MARMSKKVKNYVPVGKGVCKTEMSLFDAIQYNLNTLFDIKYAMKKAWGDEWYELARYGCYDSACKMLMTKTDCMAKTVAMRAIRDLEVLRNEMADYEKKGGDR